MKKVSNIISFLLALPVVFDQNKMIRDQYNDQVEIWRRSADRTDVYDAQTDQLLRS